MRKRALFVFDWHELTEAGLSYIASSAEAFDELIFLIDSPEAGIGGKGMVGELLVHLKDVLSVRIGKPFYLFPVTDKGVAAIYQWIRWKILCPAFQQVYTDRRPQAGAMMQVFGVPVEVHEPVRGAGERIVEWGRKDITRGLFITRAQPFHLGHAAFIGQMAQEVDEVIIILAMAERSHQAADFAMGGERMEMILPFLEATVAGRYYLLPMPNSGYTMENLYELSYLCPPFTRMYANNPVVQAMAHTAGYEVRSLNQRLLVSGTMVRECMLSDRSFREFVPDSVYAYIREAGLADRLKKVCQREDR